jgi:hypothetical protein
MEAAAADWITAALPVVSGVGLLVLVGHADKDDGRLCGWWHTL